MPQLRVAYEPIPIPWIIPHDFGRQTGPGTANVTLTVSAIDANTGAVVAGIVTSIPSLLPDLVNDPNNLSFPTNTPQEVTLFQMTSFEVPPDPLYLAPGVRVTAEGYEEVDLVLE